MKNITLADIAKATGYSINTVSHALNDKPDISEKTKKYISDVAEEMGYIANTSAGALRSGKTRSVAIIVGDISNPHFSIMIKEMEATLRRHRYSAIIMNTDEDEQLEREAIVTAMSKNVDGIILCPVQKSDANVVFLQKVGMPFILFGRRFADVDTDYVVCDDENGGFEAASFLLKNNHREILFINTELHISSARERLAGVKRAFETYGAPQPLHYAESAATGDLASISEILRAHTACTAIICFSDLMALQVCYLLKGMGRRVPADVSVIGFDNIASKFYLPLMTTSVTSSKTKMSHETVEAVLQIIEKPGRVHFQRVLPTGLVVRESTGEII